MKWFSRKCVFCRKEGNLKRVCKVWAYDSITHNYHEDCYTSVLCNPEKNGNEVVDIALEIDECLSYDRRIMKERTDRAKEACLRNAIVAEKTS